MKRLLATTLALSLLPGLAWGAKVKAWHHHASSHYDKAEFQQAVLTTEGALRLARQVKPLPGIEAAHIWEMVEDASGNLYVATGNEGKLFKITKDGGVTLAYRSEDSQILSLAAAPDGSIYAGTGPSGTLVHLAPDGSHQVIWKGVESYIWSLAVDNKGGHLYAGTGPKGRLYRISQDGKAELFYSTKQDHILCLAWAPNGLLYAGTDKQGLVYRIDSKGKGFVLWDAPQPEVRTLLITPEAVYAGTSSPSSRRSPSSVTVSSTEDRSAATPTVTPLKVGTPDKPNSTAETQEDEDKEKDKAASGATADGESSASGNSSSTAPRRSAPSVGENSVYRISLDGTVREVFREKVMVLDLLWSKDRLLIGTGGDGQLFELREAERERTELVRLDHTHIHCLHRRRDGTVVLGTGDPGRLYLLEDKYVPRGQVLSEVLDAKGLSRWGALRWQGETPSGTQLTVAVRSGNVAEPDETWSDWSTEQTDSQQAVAAAPPARFLQYRVSLVSDNPQLTPTLHRLTIRYTTINVAPEVGSIEVPDLDAVPQENPKKLLKLKWTASDANEDDLTYRLLYRKEGWKNWVELEPDLEKREYEWDTTTVPDGVYRLKVVASDRKSNSEEQALTSERISSPFVVDHIPPVVTVKVASFEGDQAIIEATAEDNHSRLVRASFAVDSGKWLNVFPVDGLADSKAETFRFKTGPLKPGTHVLVLQVADASGNTGSGDVVFEVTK